MTEEVADNYTPLVNFAEILPQNSKTEDILKKRAEEEEIKR